jgi:uncharacterized protein
MIIDFHCHVGEDISDSKYEKLDFKELKESMDKWNIDKSVVFPTNADDERLIERSLEILEKSKTEKWILPFLRVNPKTITRERFMELIENKFKGLKLHPDSQNFKVDDKEYFWIYELCQKRNIPILFHSSYKTKNSHPRTILKIVKKFPNLNVIMAHFFGGDYSLMQEAKDYPNLYVDTSINSGTLKRLQSVEKYGFKNLLFASDIPYDSQGVALMKIKEAGLSEEDEKMVLGGNALEILGLE